MSDDRFKPENNQPPPEQERRRPRHGSPTPDEIDEFVKRYEQQFDISPKSKPDANEPEEKSA